MVAASVAVVDDGKAMLVMGGVDAHHHALSSTQLVRPGHPTQPGPSLTGGVASHCSVALQGDQVIIAGGQRLADRGHGSDVVEILNTSSHQWTKTGSMKNPRDGHSRAQVWLDPDRLDGNILSGDVSNTSVLSMVVAGGKAGYIYSLYTL